MARFRAIRQGEHLMHGFRNRDIREQLYAAPETKEERRRQSAATGRLLKRLHVRGLIAKVPHTRRWQVTSHGHKILTTLPIETDEDVQRIISAYCVRWQIEVFLPNGFV